MTNLEQAIQNGFIADGCDDGEARIWLAHRNVFFYIKEVVPGKIVKFGCQQGRVPGLFATPMWAIDSNGQCWSHEGHLYMTPISSEDLLQEKRLDADNVFQVRESLKVKHGPPQWLVTAIKEGFTNPKFDLDKYDWSHVVR